MKHTPGPWCVRDFPTAPRYIGPASDGGAPSVAVVLPRVSVPSDRIDADARLIAAAPDLLELLVRATDMLPPCGLRDECHAAIAEATKDTA